MADKIRVSIRGGQDVTDETPLTRGMKSTEVWRVEAEKEGQRFVFYTDPEESELIPNPNSGFGSFVVSARIPCYFLSEPVSLGTTFNFGKKKLGSLVIGEHTIKEWSKVGSFVRVLRPSGPDPQSSPIEAVTGKKVFFGARLIELPQDADRNRRHHPSLSVALMRFQATNDDKPVLTTIFEGRATLQGAPDVYGSTDVFPTETGPEIRLVQSPDPFQPDETASAEVGTWFVGILGVPYWWGRSIWNGRLGEQIRSSQLDPQHGTFFTPLLPTANNLPLQWDVALKVVKRSGKPPQASFHSLRMTSTEDGRFEEVHFPLLRNHEGSSLRARLPIAKGVPSDRPLKSGNEYKDLSQSLIGAFGNPGISLGLRRGALGAAGGPRERTIRMGALDITFADTPASQLGVDPELRWQLESAETSELSGTIQPRETAIELDWSVETISPGGQDGLAGESYIGCKGDPVDTFPACVPGGEKAGGPDDAERELECSTRREHPLIIPLKAQSIPGLILNVNEKARLRDARRVDLKLHRADEAPPPPTPFQDRDSFLTVCSTGAEKTQDRVVILDREPFLVAKVSYPALGSLKDAAEGTLVATWQSYEPDAGAWHIRFPDAQDFCLTVPPQAVGETMEKHQTLPEDKHADFRLSPPALLSMRERYYRQNFPEAPWNLRRLLSDPSRELPGAHVEHLQYELLYGLSCRVDYPLMRLVELSALIGNVVGPLPRRPLWVPRQTTGPGQGLPEVKAGTAYQSARRKWAGYTRRVRQRLGIFELWDVRRLDTLELKENVTCWIRQQPVLDEQDPQSRVAPDPFPGELVRVPVADLADPFTKLSEQAGKLAGGVTWGFESRNVYNAVMRPPREGTWPRSNGAEIKDTRFSALGGYGHQMAAFDFWRSKVLADVAMGRTYSYTLERIGRIAVWWNRAKHVIVYERTVVRSRQFGNSDLNCTTDEQNPLEGRAVVRKVAEYVEILQNVRKYPDTENGTPRATGFVTECSFADDPNQVVRFRVRSSWGTDIGTEGWKVPLWRRGEKPEDVYPKPVVNLTVMANVEGESVPRKVTIADPENLFFYTDTTVPVRADGSRSDDLSNTDAWKPVEGVDYVDEARPKPRREPAFEAGSLRQTGAADAVIAPGFRPCTFLIDPAEHTVDLLAYRQGKPMGTPLSSVTLCRAVLEPSSSAVMGEYRALTEGIESKAAEWLAQIPGDGRLPEGIDPAAGIKELCGHVAKEAGDFSTHLEKIQGKQLDDLSDKVAARARARIDAILESFLGQAKTSEVGRALQKSLESLKGVRDAKAHLTEEISRGVDDLGQRIEAFLPSPAVLTDSAYSALLLVREQLGAVAAQSAALQRRLASGDEDDKALGELEILATAYVDRLDQALERIQRQAESATQIEIDVEGVQRAVPFVQGIQKALDTVRARLSAIAAQAAQARQALTLLRSWRSRTLEMKKEVRGRILTLLREGTAWLGTVDQTLDQNLQELQGIQPKLTALKRKWAQDLKKELNGTIDAVLRSVPDPTSQIPPFPDDWRRILGDQKAILLKQIDRQVETIKTERALWFKPPEKISKKVEALCPDLEQQINAFVKDLGRDAEAVRKYLEDRRDEIVRSLDRTFGDDVRAARKLLGEVESRRDDVLKLARAFGKPPDVSGLKFDRPEIAFFYNEIKDRVDVTPVIARAAQAAAIVDALKPFGVDLPVKELGEQLIPESLKNFDLSSILPDIAGIPLKNLFSGIKMPDTGDTVRIRHGADAQTRRAWVNADVDFPIPGNKTLFAVGPLAVRINEPHFKAEARMEVDVRGVQQRSVKGRLTGDWQLQIGSFDLITFQQTPLEFDEGGHVTFDVDPANVQMAPALTFINALLDKISPAGVTTRFDGDGVVSTLDIPIPDTQIGAFGFSGLNLGASLALRTGGGFNIGVTASLGRRDAPFTLTVFILGGAGYIELGSQYFPATGKVEAVADLAIAASASLAIALGPIQGGVEVYVGVTAQYNSRQGGGLTAGLLFMIRGHVSVLSIASATIILRLDAQYQGGALVGRGHLEIKIKICWCFTLEVSESVTYTLGRVGSGQNVWLGGPQPVAQIAQVGGRIAGGVAPPQKGFNPDLLQERIDDYFDMLV